MLYVGGKLIIAVLLAPLLLILMLDNFDYYLKPALMLCMFVYYYFDITRRIQLINLFSYVLIIYFLINFNKNLFHKYSLPIWVKFSSALLILAVLLSSINSPFVSLKSIYYGFMFCIYIFTGYIVFKTLLSLSDIDEYLKYLIYAVAIYSIFIFINILLTGNFRARGLTGSAFSDIIVCSLLIVIYKNLFFEKSSAIYVVIAFILFFALIFDQSRFAWVGFALSFLYGLIITSIYQRTKLMKKRLITILSSIFVGMLVVFISGLYRLIIMRFSDVTFSVLQSNAQNDIVANSLDTMVLIWLTALSAFINNPLTGVGYFMFYSVSENYNVLPEFLYRDIVMGLDAHSTLINFLCETGIIGFLSILFLFIVIFVLSIKAITISKTISDSSRSLALNILVFFIETTCFYSGAYTFGYNGYFLYFIFALVIANYVLLRKKQLTVKLEHL